MSKTPLQPIFRGNLLLEEVGEDLKIYIMELSKITFFDKPVTYDVFLKKMIYLNIVTIKVILFI
jgi:hypothetical protein